MSTLNDASRALAELVLAGQITPNAVLTFATVVEDLGDGTITVRPDGSPEGTVVGPVRVLGG